MTTTTATVATATAAATTTATAAATTTATVDTTAAAADAAAAAAAEETFGIEHINPKDTVLQATIADLRQQLAALKMEPAALRNYAEQPYNALESKYNALESKYKKLRTKYKKLRTKSRCSDNILNAYFKKRPTGYKTLSEVVLCNAAEGIVMNPKFVDNRLGKKCRPLLCVGSGDGSGEKGLVALRRDRGFSKNDAWEGVKISGWFGLQEVVQGIPSHNVIKKNVDAQNLAPFIDYGLPSKSDILFNCPWLDWNCNERLLQNFLRSAADIQEVGSYVFIGITEDSIYFHTYGIQNVVKEVQGYRLRCLDTGIISKLRKNGYNHLCKKGKNIGGSIYPYHVMLCFERTLTLETLALNSVPEDTTTRLQATIADLRKQLAASETEAVALRNDVEQLQRDLEKSNEARWSLRGTLDTLEGKYEALESKYNDHRTLNPNTQSDYDALKEKYKALESKYRHHRKLGP
ncbi:hypothetical protein BDR26DRAFT_925497 [Obelidium mucronatum]|nr:hypothetical protein BDR26DRAFT_925497 [Obelidium mucronatum]